MFNTSETGDETLNLGGHELEDVGKASNSSSAPLRRKK